jgi:Tfp pilus assembly protein PilX
MMVRVHRQRGVTLIVGLIMLVLISMMVASAFTLNSGNLKAVGNMQLRNEVIAAANKAVEQAIQSSFPTGFTTLPPVQTIRLDIDNDGVDDYSVSVATPVCVEVSLSSGSTGTGTCGGFRAGGLAGCATSTYSSMWNIQAQVTDTASGAQVEMHQGVRMELSDGQRAAVCP